MSRPPILEYINSDFGTVQRVFLAIRASLPKFDAWQPQGSRLQSKFRSQNHGNGAEERWLKAVGSPLLGLKVREKSMHVRRRM
jgi:hypothetical protein